MQNSKELFEPFIRSLFIALLDYVLTELDRMLLVAAVQSSNQARDWIVGGAPKQYAWVEVGAEESMVALNERWVTKG